MFPTSENQSAPVPGATGANTVSSETVDNRETQDVREIKPSILRAPEHQQHLLKQPASTTLHYFALRVRGGGVAAPHLNISRQCNGLVLP